MANLGGTYEASNETMSERSALPAGEYVAVLVKSDHTEAKSGNGNAYINCEFEITDGEHKGRRFWSLLNLWNSNPTAVEMAQRELNSMMHACGKLRIADTEELHGIPMLVKLKVKTDSYGDKNEVVSYAQVGASAPPARPSAPPAQAPAPAGRSAPWARSA